MIFGVPAGLLALFSRRFVLCLAVLVGSCLAILVVISAGFVTLDGRSVVMDLLPGPESRPRRVSWMSCCFYSGTSLGRPLVFWRVPCLFGTVLIGLLVGLLLGACLLVVMLLTLFLVRRQRFVSLRVEYGAPTAMPGFRGGGGVGWMSEPGGGVKRFRPNRKSPAQLVRHGILGDSPSATCLEETEGLGSRQLGSC